MSADDFVYRPPGAPKPKGPAYSEDGVDLTLIRWMLTLTPRERLRQLDAFITGLEAMRMKIERWTPKES